MLITALLAIWQQPVHCQLQMVQQTSGAFSHMRQRLAALTEDIGDARAMDNLPDSTAEQPDIHSLLSGLQVSCKLAVGCSLSTHNCC